MAPPACARQRTLGALGAVFSIAALVALGDLGRPSGRARRCPAARASSPSSAARSPSTSPAARCAPSAGSSCCATTARSRGAIDAYGLLAVANAGNNVLPARAGDALRVVLITPRAKTDPRTVIGTIVAERVLDVVVLVGLFVVLAYGVLGGIEMPSVGPARVRRRARRGAHRGERAGGLDPAPPRAPEARDRVPRPDGRGDAQPALQPRPAAAGDHAGGLGAGVGRLVADRATRSASTSRCWRSATSWAWPRSSRSCRAGPATSARSTRRSSSASARSSTPAPRRSPTCCCCASS